MKFFRIFVLLCLIIPSMVFIDPSINSSTGKFYQKKKRLIPRENIRIFQIKENVDDFNSRIFFEKYILSRKSRKLKKSLVPRIVDIIFQYAAKYNIHPIVILAIQSVESNFWYRAKGPFGELGTMQVNVEVWVDDESNPNNLIRNGILRRTSDLHYIGRGGHAGIFILSLMKKRCEKIKKRKKLRAYGYHSVSNCMIQKYNGRRNKGYYRKVTSVIGDYYFFQKVEKVK